MLPGDSAIVGMWLLPFGDGLRGGLSEAGGDREPMGLLGESGALISAVLVVAVMGR